MLVPTAVTESLCPGRAHNVRPTAGAGKKRRAELEESRSIARATVGAGKKRRAELEESRSIARATVGAGKKGGLLARATIIMNYEL